MQVSHLGGYESFCIDFEYYTAVQREVNISVIKFDLHTDQKQKINFVLPYSMATLQLNMHMLIKPY